MGISPSGDVTFLSQLWGGNASDKHIFKESGLLDLPLKVTLNVPPKRDSNRQLTRRKVEETRRIAAVRIHVERKMEKIKHFTILHGIVPATEWNNANNIILICAALTNFESPVVK